MALRVVATCAALLAIGSGCAAPGTGASSSQGSPASPFTSASNGPTHTTGGPSTHAPRKAAFLRVRPKMSMRQVAALLGDPLFRLQSTPQELCWLYGRSRDDLSGGTVCFTGGRVSFVATPEVASVEFRVTTE